MKLTFNLERQGYDVVVKPGSLGRLGRLAGLCGRVMVLTDRGVPQQYVKAVMAQCDNPVLLVLAEGEASKTPDAWQAVVSRLLAEGFTGGDVLVAVGGGVVGDIAGFSAAGYRGGLQLYHCPTTLAAQLDACVGGRAALNLLGQKDVLLAHHQPAFVAVDPGLISTLPGRHVAAGMALALRTALVASPELFEVLENEAAEVCLERVICLSLLCKKELLQAAPPGEAGLLNFGQLLAGGLWGGLLYGECVALGMLPMIESRALLRRTLRVMDKLGLPTRPPCAPEEILAGVGHGAAADNGLYRVVRVKKLGQGYQDLITREELELLAQAEAPAGP